MGLGSADAASMSFWEYDARMHHWAEANDPDDAAIVDPAHTQRIIDDLKSRPELLKANPKATKRKVAVPFA